MDKKTYERQLIGQREDLKEEFKRLLESEVKQQPLQMNRAERRRMARSAKKFDQRNSFTREEVEKANASAYEYGKRLALKAAKKVLKLGETRLNRIEEELKRQEYETFVKPFEDMEGVSSNEK